MKRDENGKVKIILDYAVTKEAEERVRRLIEWTIWHDANWSGANIVLDRGDGTCVDSGDEIAGQQLLCDVFHAIETGPEGS